MITHMDPEDFPTAYGFKALPLAALRRNGRWDHPEAFRVRELAPFRAKVAAMIGSDDFIVEAYITRDDENILLVAFPTVEE